MVCSLHGVGTPMMRIAPLTPALLLLACGPAVEVSEGQASGPCGDGCDPGLGCVEGECIDPNGSTGPSGTTTAPPSGSGGGGSEGEGTTTGGDGSDADGSSGPPPPAAQSIDILFVVDNSGTMGEAQANLARSAAAFTVPLLASGLSVRVAVTTTDDGNYWCQGSGVSPPESGHYVSTSCRSRLGDFYAASTDTNAEGACTDACAFDTIEILPTTIAGGSNAAPRPWLEVSPDDTNIGADASFQDALQCILPQGVNGCGFESPLESANKALVLGLTHSAPEYDFLRHDADLAVIFITDEVDCSDNPEHESTVFGEEGVGNQVFWSLPEQQVVPTSAVCWNAGVTCDFSKGTNPCTHADKAPDGTDAATGDDAALYPVDRFRETLTTISEMKDPGTKVFTFGIVGVPNSYPSDGQLEYAPGPNAQDPDSFQARFGMGPACSSPVTDAVPPVRLRAFVEDAPWAEDSQLYSVCDTDYAPTLEAIANRVFSR